MTGVLLSFWLPSATGAAAASHGTRIGNQANQARSPFRKFLPSPSKFVRSPILPSSTVASRRGARGARCALHVCCRAFTSFPRNYRRSCPPHLAPRARRRLASVLRNCFHFPTGNQAARHRLALTKVFGGASGGHGWRRRRLRQLSTGWRKTLLNSQVLFQTMSGEETFLECNFAFVRPRKTFSTIAIAIAALSKLYPL